MATILQIVETRRTRVSTILTFSPHFIFNYQLITQCTRDKVVRGCWQAADKLLINCWKGHCQKQRLRRLLQLVWHDDSLNIYEGLHYFVHGFQIGFFLSFQCTSKIICINVRYMIRKECVTTITLGDFCRIVFGNIQIKRC